MTMTLCEVYPGAKVITPRARASGGESFPGVYLVDEVATWGRQCTRDLLLGRTDVQCRHIGNRWQYTPMQETELDCSVAAKLDEMAIWKVLESSKTHEASVERIQLSHAIVQA